MNRITRKHYLLLISSILEEIILQPFDTLPNYWLFFILLSISKEKVNHELY